MTTSTATPTVTNTPIYRGWGLHCRIGDNLYRLVDLPEAQASIVTAPPTPPRIDTSANPEDIRPDVGVVFSLVEFHGGEGQLNLHRPDSSHTRFWDSAGVDVEPPAPGRTAALSLLHDTDIIDATTETALALVYDGTALYMAKGETVRRSTTHLDATPSFADDNPHAGQGSTDVLDLVTLGDKVYAALGASGIHERDGTWSHWSDLQAVKVWEAKSRIIASTGAALYSAGSVATSVLLHTLPDGHSWTAVVEAGSFILAGATDGVVYAFALDETDASLTIAARTRVSPTLGVTALGAHSSGLVFYGLGNGDGTGNTLGQFFRAAISESGTLTFGAKIRQWGDYSAADSYAPAAIIAHGESVYTGVLDESGNANLWRYDLESTGRARHLATASPNQIVSILPVGDRLFFTQAGVGLIREDVATYVSTGYVITSLADHFIASDKNWAALVLDIEALNDGSVQVYVTTNPDAVRDPDHAQWLRVRTETNLLGDAESSLSAVSRYLALKVVLNAPDTLTATPSLRSVAVRSFAGPGDMIIELPINISDQIEMPGMRRLKIPGYGHNVYNTLQGMEQTSQSVELFDPSLIVNGVIEQVAAPIYALNTIGSKTKVAMVRVRGRRGTRSGLDVESTFGSFAFGEMAFGGIA